MDAVGTVGTAYARLGDASTRLAVVAGQKLPLWIGRERRIGELDDAVDGALELVRAAQQQLAPHATHAGAAGRLDAALGAHALREVVSPIQSAKLLIEDLRPIRAELSPGAAHVDDVFARDAQGWTPEQIATVRSAIADDPELAAHPVLASTFTANNETMGVDNALGYLTTTRDKFDFGVNNRFAAAWREARLPEQPLEAKQRILDELFATDPATWSTRAFHGARAMVSATPELARHPALSQTHKINNETLTFTSTMDYLGTTHDEHDLNAAARFAASWRAHRSIEAGDGGLPERVSDVFRRDASTWTPSEIAELRTIIYELPKDLRPAGPRNLEGINLRPPDKDKEEQGFRYSLLEILDYLTTTRDRTDMVAANQFAEAWLMQSRPAQEDVLDQLRRSVANPALAVTTPGGRPPSDVTLALLGDEFLGEAGDGLERAARAATLLQYTYTNRQIVPLLREIDTHLPFIPGERSRPLVAQARELVQLNLGRIDGSVPTDNGTAANRGLGMRQHANYSELGRIRPLVQLARIVDAGERAPVTPTAVAPTVEHVAPSAPPAIAPPAMATPRGAASSSETLDW
ncbi:MAG: hypothetical protein JWL76_1262 [Thermoleophilia bacterium]|nr:hypothetical protein [Thermoleophilia bacterium]